jgi:putative tryptophan/tyrosine transport system substrate-binding protein
VKRREFFRLVGGAAVLPLAVRAQQPVKQHRIAIVHPTLPPKMLTETGGTPYYPFFFAELRRRGYVEGQNLIIDRHSGEGREDEFAILARDVVGSTPDVIFTLGMIQAFKIATETIPIVAVATDPVGLGFAVSLARPGGNLTGVVVGSDYGLWEKRFELLREVVPAVSTVTFLPVVRAWESFPYFRAVRDAAQKVGISLTFVPFNSPFDEPEYRRVFATLGTERMGAIAINEGGNTFTHRRLIVQLIDELRVPAVYPFRDFVEAGGLMSNTTG